MIYSAGLPAGTDPVTRAALFAEMREHSQIISVTNTTTRAALISTLAGLSPAIVPSASNPVYVYRQDAAAGANIEYTTDGTTWRCLVAGATLTSVAITMGSGWAAATGTPTVYREGGWANLDGIVVRTSGSSTTLGTIPSGYRPQRTISMPLTTENPSSAQGPVAHLEITTTGDLIAEVRTGGPSWTTDTWFTLACTPWRTA